jgi:hypothetical protein
MTLDDAIFYELARSTLGKLTTPFHKQRIVEDLAAFLARPQIQDAIAAYIDNGDHKIIAAIVTLADPTQAEIEGFFAGEYGAAGVNALIINLEERLIVYRRESSIYNRKIMRLSLNPLLANVLLPFTTATGILFPAHKTDAANTADTERPRMDDRLLAAVLCLVMSEGDILKADGNLRKKAAAKVSDIFPNTDIYTLIGGLQKTGLLRVEEERLTLNPKKILEFTNLSGAQRLAVVAGGIYQNSIEKASGTVAEFEFMALRQAQQVASFIRGLLGTLDPGLTYSETTFRRLAFVLKKEYFTDSVTGENANLDFETLIAAMEKTGLILKTGAGFSVRAGDAAESGENGPYIAFDSSLSLVLLPGIDFADAMELAWLCEVRETGTTVRFEITCQQVIKAFDQGLDEKEALDLLDALSGGRVGESLPWQLTEWKKRYTEVSLYSGLVLTLAPERRYIVETGSLSRMITASPAPGVYILNAREEEQVITALKKAGVDIVSAPKGIRRQIRTSGQRHYRNPPDQKTPLPGSGLPAEDVSGTTSRQTKAAEYKAQFQTALKEARLTQAEKEELTSRIERRLIVSTEQLKSGFHIDKLEARGLDFTGKANIAKQAVAGKSIIEITLSNTASGGSHTITGSAEALEKQGSETILVFKDAEDKLSRIPVGKISVLRRIKNSIFD